MSNPPPLVAALGRDLGVVGRVLVAVPPRGMSPLESGVRAAGAQEGCQVGHWRQLWVHLTLSMAQGKGHGGAFGCWRTVPLAHLFAAVFLRGATPYLLWHLRKQ